MDIGIPIPNITPPTSPEAIERIARQRLQCRLGAQGARGPVQLRVEHRQKAEGAPPHRPRHELANPLLVAMETVAAVSREDLVAAIA